MEKVKALIAVALFVATVLFTSNNNETRPKSGKFSDTKKVNTPVIEQDSIYKSPVSFR